MDETLLDFSKAERVNFFNTLMQFGIDADEGMYARYHEINDALWKLLERGGITRDRLIIRRFEALFEECGIETEAEEVARAFFKNFEEVCFPFEGACEFLNTLSSRGRVYIVTNGGKYIQKRHIADAGFEPYLSGVFISEEVGFHKPDIRFAEHVEAHIPNYRRERAVWLGDSLTSDMGCANSLGIDFVLFSPHGIPEGYAGAFVKNYAEFLDNLKTN